MNPDWSATDLGLGRDFTAWNIQLILTSPIPDGDVATLHQICAERAKQIREHGHSPAADAALPLHFLPRRAGKYLNDACEYASLGRTDVAVPKLLKAAALIIAAIARIRMEPSEHQP